MKNSLEDSSTFQQAEERGKCEASAQSFVGKCHKEASNAMFRKTCHSSKNHILPEVISCVEKQDQKEADVVQLWSYSRWHTFPIFLEKANEEISGPQRPGGDHQYTNTHIGKERKDKLWHFLIVEYYTAKKINKGYTPQHG